MLIMASWKTNTEVSVKPLFFKEEDIFTKTELQTKFIKQFEVVSAAEAVNVYHNGRNVGAEPVKLLIFYVGTTDQTLTVKENEE